MRKLNQSHYEVIRGGGITVAMGYKCPDCGIVYSRPLCTNCPAPEPTRLVVARALLQSQINALGKRLADNHSKLTGYLGQKEPR